MSTKLPSVPEPGMEVCDCRYVHQKVRRVLEEADPHFWEEEGQQVRDYAVQLEDGLICSWRNCCDPVDHEWEHPTAAKRLEDLEHNLSSKRHYIRH